MAAKFGLGPMSAPVFRLVPFAIGRQPALTANEEFKQSFWPTFRVGLTAAVAVHMAVFGILPSFRVADMATASETMSLVELPPTVDVPPPPEAIARPATPRVAAVEMNEELTIAPTTFEQNPVENLGPPPDVASADDRPAFIPYTVAPKLRNKDETLALLQRLYPMPLRSAGIGGTVVLWIYIDTEGAVTRTQVATSSGYAALDEAAQEVAKGMRFSPAMNRDRVTAVWLSQPITFEVV
jgi:TonB family protein